MGRHKLPMKKINEETNLQVTYSKRKKGLMKKTYELSVLSDIDAAFISISGTGRVSSFSATTRFSPSLITFHINQIDMKI